MTYSQSEVLTKVSELELDGSKISTVVEGRAFINGKCVDAKSGEWLTTLNPATGREVARIASCDKADVDLAVAAARSTFKSGVWRNMVATERRDVMLKLASLIMENALELGVYESVEGGMPVGDCVNFLMPGCEMYMKYHAEAINKVYGKVSPTTTDKLGLVIHEPIGVCGLIVPWNCPLFAAVGKVAPALATGNSVVLKPSEMTSLSAIKFAQLALDAGVPPGVLNVVPGYGATVGAAMSSHMDINMLGFTGSTATGRSILKAAADSNMKRCALELGGKSPMIIFDDCCEDDEGLDVVAQHVFVAAFGSQGENCMCGSRLLVQRGIKDRLLAKIIDLVKSGEFKVGDPLNLESFNGSLISSQHASKVMDYIETGKREGAKLLIGGERSANFVSLTVFDEVDSSMTIAKEEIFGPVLSVFTFDTEAEAIEMANDTDYGLYAGIFTLNLNRAHRVSRQVEAGTVSINCYSEGDETVTFGGHKMSGFGGCEKSLMAFQSYQEVKTVWLEIAD